MLDDEAFARAWVESRDRARPRGERAIRQELGLKGVDRPTIDLVLSERREAAAGIPSDDGEMAISPDQAAAERLLAATPAAWRASPTLASGASVRTRCSPATGSIPRCAATVAAQVEVDRHRRAARGPTERGRDTLRLGGGSVDPRGGPP